MSTTDEPTVLYTETVVTDHKGNKTKTTTGRKIGGSGQRYYTTTATKTKTDADGRVTTMETSTTYERTGGQDDEQLNAYKQAYKAPHLKEAPAWEKPQWAQPGGVHAGSSLADGRNLEKPITAATERKAPATFHTFKLEK